MELVPTNRRTGAPMTTRRQFITASALAAMAVFPLPAGADEGTDTGRRRNDKNRGVCVVRSRGATALH
jgi:hypothetical protein